MRKWVVLVGLVLAPVAHLHASRVAVGDDHSCSVVDGGVRCWGSNTFGQLGVAHLKSSTFAVDVASLEPGRGFNVVGIAATKKTTCAVRDGGVLCWGSNRLGLLGDGSDVSARFLPAPVSGLAPGSGAGVTAISGSNEHFCVIAKGGLACWGANGSGQLGIGVKGNEKTTPQAVVGLAPGGNAGVIAVSAGPHHTCASGLFGVKCWGANDYGNLGDGTDADSASPVAVNNIAETVSTVSTNLFTSCASVAAGIRCWGSYYLGSDATHVSKVPVPVADIAEPASALSGAGTYTCAVISVGVRCWGLGQYGQLGYGSTDRAEVPVDVSGLDPLYAGDFELATGFYHACASHYLLGTRCWGRKGDGALGNGESEDVPSPRPASLDNDYWFAIRSGASHSCGMAGSELKCWGENWDYEVSTSSARVISAPAPFSPSVSPSSFGTGANHTCIVDFNIVRCRGDNSDGQLGRDPEVTSSSSSWVAASGMSTANKLYAGAYSTCAANLDGSFHCWGRGGARGWTDAPAASWQPKLMHAGPVTDAAIGVSHACIVVNGGVACIGSNSEGQVGNDSHTAYDLFVDVHGIGPGSGATAVAVGDRHTCAVVKGGVKCWGLNLNGQLGIAAIEGEEVDDSSAVPVDVTGLGEGIGATLIVAGGDHTCAIVAGVAKCWGAGADGQLGAADEEDSYLPRTVTGMSSGVTALSAGLYHTCAIRNGNVWCWGESLDGKLGGYELGIRTTPQPVLAAYLFRSGFEPPNP